MGKSNLSVNQQRTVGGCKTVFAADELASELFFWTGVNLVGKIGLAVIEFEWTGLRHSVKWSGIAESFSSLRDEKDFLFYEI